MIEKRYLGDAVHAEFDGYHIKLTVNNGMFTTDVISLDPSVRSALRAYMNDLDKAIQRFNGGTDARSSGGSNEG